MSDAPEKTRFGHCRDCFWWTGEVHNGFGECRLASSRGQPETKAFSDSLAFAYSFGPYESCDNYLATHPGFGCVQFRDRQDGASSLSDLVGIFLAPTKQKVSP